MRKIKVKLKVRYFVFGAFYPALMAGLLVFQNCAPVSFVPIPQNGNGLNQVSSTASPICNPLTNGTGVGTGQNGVLTTITYLPPTSSVVTQTSLSTASFLPGQPDVQVIPNPVYLNEFSIFTQNFTLGFQTANGTDVVDLNGNELDQYFSLQSQGFIGAATPGAYQFAILSDDGSVFYIGDGQGHFQPLINNDGSHSNRFSCAQTVVNVGANSLIPFQINYYQGPPVRLGLMLFWRIVDPGNSTTMADPLCPSPQFGTTEGDEYFFGVDPNSGLPVPTTNYDNPAAGSTTGILNRGWQVVPAQSFFLTQGTSNPCNN